MRQGSHRHGTNILTAADFSEGSPGTGRAPGTDPEPINHQGTARPKIRGPFGKGPLLRIGSCTREGWI